MDYRVVLSGLVVGVAFGFVLQRGRFCLNTAFRNALYIREFTLLRAYLLALLIAMAGANLLDLGGVIHLNRTAPSMHWLAAAIGGYLFGAGMVLGGGDAAGTWARAGEGLAGSWMTLFGIMVGAASAAGGALSGITAYLTSAAPSSDTLFTIPAVLGVNRWIVIGVLSLACLSFLLLGRSSYSAAQTGYHWKTSGALVGLLIVLGLFASERMTGVPSGITFPLPTGDVLQAAVAGQRLSWGASLVLGIPLGSFISSRGLREFSWRAPRAVVMVQQLGGGLLMGIGGTLAGGCSIGHGLSGMASLALPSFLAMTFIVLGCLSMVYILFMREPMK